MKTLIVHKADYSNLRQVPDSALLTGGRPLFLPEECDGVVLSVLPAVRISRLGLGINEKFAGRYFDSATLVAVPMPSGCVSLSEIDLVADNAMVIGEWQPLPSSHECRWQVECPDGTMVEWLLEGVFEKVISGISRRTTFKTGDILAIQDAVPNASATVSLGSKPCWKLNGADTLCFKIK